MHNNESNEFIIEAELYERTISPLAHAKRQGRGKASVIDHKRLTGISAIFS